MVLDTSNIGYVSRVKWSCLGKAGDVVLVKKKNTFPLMDFDMPADCRLKEKEGKILGCWKRKF